MEYRGNSIASRQQQVDIQEQPQKEKMEQIATGKKVERSAGSKILSAYFAEDLRNICHEVLYEVIIPASKNAISDTICNFVDIALFGQTRGRTTAGSVKRITPYSSLYSNNVSSNRIVKYNDISEQRHANRGLGGYSYQEVVLATRPEAEDVLAHMRLYLDRYQVVTVADLYDAVGEVPDMIDNKWGWTDLSGAAVQRCSDGFILRMPRIEPI